MKLTTENIKKHYLILIVKLFIISLFLLSVIQGKIKSSDYWIASGNPFFFWKEISFYRASILLIVPFIGIFINKKIGWILIQSYFYFLMSNLVYSMKHLDLTEKSFVIINITIAILVLLLLILMNEKKISYEFYGFGKTEFISKNIIASIIGISMTVALTWLKVHGI